MNSIRIAESDDEIARCFAVMQQLRTHLIEGEFVPTVRRQQINGYRLVYLEERGQVRSVAGYRLIENLANGRILYVDDLVTDAACRSRGYGKALLAWLVQRAREHGCRTLELDSAVQRSDAHRFYLANGMVISSYHFRLKL
ncbi:MAG: GNAT family N-acetyltransferase [Armatimonadota bacterium]|nr:GNAT family N-acetyltransferase [Armatimonadota bacterium]MDR7448151.1 GNAT family N-acetyltransferase [Armatimonadota bacterium]MDR7460489.1 GNAT family N-acetyltransferase [Armatimonadota bacterium]MDR7478238.1 GNAT family N-acetyltransferase [Armatimonadota bacterium]MDR7488851.1 GNAT family N-acetyltransferase [Armatimonadota bacterium]